MNNDISSINNEIMKRSADALLDRDISKLEELDRLSKAFTHDEFTRMAHKKLIMSMIKFIKNN